MPKVVIEMSLSLDEFIAGPDDAVDQPFGGRDARRLHDWLLAGPQPYEVNSFFRPAGRNREFVDPLFRTTGALLTGRRTYDLVNGWAAPTRYRACRLSCSRMRHPPTSQG